MYKGKNYIAKQWSMLLMAGVMCVLGGCAKDGLEMPEDAYFLCAAGWNYEPGVKLLNSKGEVCLQVENACIKHCVDAEGNILHQSAGVIPSDTVLFIDIDKSPDDELLDSGIWDVDEEKWIIEPGNGVILPATKDDVLDSFVIGNQQYGADYKPMELYPEPTYSFADGLVLKNKLGRDYKNYICDQYENEYLRIGNFLRINKDSGIDFSKAQEITIEDSILGKYMVVGVYVWKLSPDGTEYGIPCKYLCDMEGKILFPELNYETIFYPEDQYDNSSRKYIQLYIDENSPSQFYDLEKEELVVFPEGCVDIDYATQDYFLLNDGSKKQIYHAKSQKLGITIEQENPGNVYILGLESYVVQDFVENKIVIEGKVHGLDGMLPSVGENVYPIIEIGKLFGPKESYYILNQEGELVLVTKEHVCYADEFQYLVLTDEMEYVIRSY